MQAEIQKILERVKSSCDIQQLSWIMDIHFRNPRANHARHNRRTQLFNRETALSNLKVTLHLPTAPHKHKWIQNLFSYFLSHSLNVCIRRFPHKMNILVPFFWLKSHHRLFVDILYEVEFSTNYYCLLMLYNFSVLFYNFGRIKSMIVCRTLYTKKFWFSLTSILWWKE